jgi:hypothetical protein
MPSEVLGDRLPVLLVLLDRKIHKPEHAEDPSCENPGKQWPPHDILPCLNSDGCLRALCVSLDFPITEKGNDHSPYRPIPDKQENHS